MGTRIALSKSIRFRVFDRDGFVCRYCGESPPSVKLVVDHLIPVIEGGENDDANLVTSCEACNQGKGSKRLSVGPPDTAARCRSQELLEQIDAAKLTKEAAKARKVLRGEWQEQLHEISGLETVLKASITSLCRLSIEFGPEQLLDWLDRAESIAGDSRDRETTMMKYVHGCARTTRAG